jgi:large subunit ribosomal protein L10
MKTREDKAQAISDFTDGVATATNAFLIDFKGITVPQVTELRKQVRETGSNYVVIKNTLALIGVKDAPLTKLSEHFTGMTAIAYNTTDPVALAKVLTKFAKDVPSVQFKGALLAGNVIAAKEISNIANLPTRDELLGKLLYLMQHPIRGLAVVLNGTMRNFAVVLNEVAKQKGESGGGEAPAEANA